MKLSTAIALALIIFSMCSIAGSAPPRLSPPPPPPPPKPYNYILMVTTWPPSYCLTSNDCEEATLRTRLGFYTHGLWPADRKAKSLQPCIGEIYINLEGFLKQLDSGLISELEEKWPSIKRSESNELSWYHQWKKHGTCSQDTLPVKDYFWRGLEQTEKLKNLVEALASVKITPSDSQLYTKAQIEAGVQILIGKGNHIYVSCREDANKSPVLFEIYVCLDVSAMTYVSCPVYNKQKGCGPDSTTPTIKMSPFTFQDAPEHDEL